MNGMFSQGVTAYNAGFRPIAPAAHPAPAAAWAVAAHAPQGKRRTAAADPSVDGGFA